MSTGARTDSDTTVREAAEPSVRSAVDHEYLILYDPRNAQEGYLWGEYVEVEP